MCEQAQDEILHRVTCLRVRGARPNLRGGNRSVRLLKCRYRQVETTNELTSRLLARIAVTIFKIRPALLHSHRHRSYYRVAKVDTLNPRSS